MSVWNTHPLNARHRVSFMAMIAVAIMVGGLLLTHHTPSTATIIDAAAPHTWVPVVESTFDQPRPVDWDGYISRVFVGGEGIEVISSSAQGGVFQAYMPAGQVSPITSGPVMVHGNWVGYTCAYGGHGGGCVPEVNISSIESEPIEPQ